MAVFHRAEHNLWQSKILDIAARCNIVARHVDTKHVSEDFQKHFMCLPQNVAHVAK